MPEQKILDAMVSSFKYRNFNMYPPYDGINELKEAIIHYYKSSYSVSLNMDEVIVLIGSKEGLFHMIPAVCDIGIMHLYQNQPILYMKRPVNYGALIIINSI